MRWAERGLSPVKASLLGIALLVVASYFIFTKQLPFTHHYTVKAVVQTSNLLAPGSPVRIGGVDVGKVAGTSRYRNTNLGLVTMQLDNSGRPIHRDATIWIRPRLYLEGNFYVDLSPGTPNAPELPDGGTIPLAQTRGPVQIDQVLDTFPASIRYELQQALQEFGVALDTTPSAADDARLEPAVRGLTGGQAINKTFDTSAASLRDSAIVSEALTGPTGQQLPQVIAGFARASAGLARADGQLTALVSEFDRTMQATAAQQQPLRQAVALLGPTAQHANTAFGALNQAFPATEQFSNALANSLPDLPATITAADPWLAQAGPLLSPAELQGLLSDLAPASSELAQLTHDTRTFLPQIDAFDRCISNVFLPTGNLVISDGSLSTGVPNYQEFWYAMTGQAAEGQGADGNGNFLRIGAAGGTYPVESGQTNYYGNSDTGFSLMPAPPQATRPAYPNQVPPLQRTVPCYTQPVPNVNGPASTGPADGSRPNAPAPPVPNDPSSNIPTGS
jgi:phospholipid/cholesterol/gamma-HCH transport system substrate-binding protein